MADFEAEATQHLQLPAAEREPILRRRSAETIAPLRQHFGERPTVYPPPVPR